MTVSQTFLILDALGSGEGGQEFGSCPSIGVRLVCFSQSGWSNVLVCSDTPGHLAWPCGSPAFPSSFHSTLPIPSASLCPLLELPSLPSPGVPAACRVVPFTEYVQTLWCF